jgi:hypothetical protein
MYTSAVLDGALLWHILCSHISGETRGVHERDHHSFCIYKKDFHTEIVFSDFDNRLMGSVVVRRNKNRLELFSSASTKIGK